MKQNIKHCLTLKRLKNRYKKQPRNKKKKTGSETKETSTMSLDSKHPSSRSSTGLPGTDKDTRKMNVSSDRLKKAETASPDQQQLPNFGTAVGLGPVLIN